MRKLATIREIAELAPIPGADKIEAARLDGWWVVVKKGEFQVGDHAVYFEIDSWIPEPIAPFLFKGKEYQGVPGARMKTVRMRGQLSQGLAIPLKAVPESVAQVLITLDGRFEVGQDLTEALGVLKWEKPEVSGGCWATRGGRPRGNFPVFLRKTDQERVQNLAGRLWDSRVPLSPDTWEVTEKLDGTSLTVYCKDGQLGVCSRNLDLQEGDSLYWTVARDSGALAFLAGLGRNLALQGEIVGEGVQGNKYQLTGNALYVFDVFDIDQQCYLLPAARRELLEGSGLSHVPVLSATDPLRANLAATLLEAEGRSALRQHTTREGLVWKHNTKPFTFKVISNLFLLGEKD